jgi:hypothetical protein
MFRARRGRSRKRSHTGATGALLLVALFLCFMLVRSALGLWIALVLVIAALVYGRNAVSRQVAFDHDWHALERLRTLSGVEFEHHVAELYRRLGYHVQLTRGSGDQGIDVIAQSPRERIGIQCKQWADVVGNAGVQEAIAGRAYYNCSRAAVVCTSAYTSPARELASRASIQLIDGPAYAAMINQFQQVAKPSGVAAWVPRGRAAALQAVLLTSALLIFVLHFAFQRAATAITQSNTLPQYYYLRATAMPYRSSNIPVSSTLAVTVERFYMDLNAHDYAAAYSLLSPSFQRSAPYSKWLDGYADTLLSTPRITVGHDPGSVSVVITARERTPSGSGTQVTIYSGALQGIQTRSGSWLIDSGYYKMVSRARR